jgi:hypothetical protein
MRVRERIGAADMPDDGLGLIRETSRFHRGDGYADVARLMPGDPVSIFDWVVGPIDVMMALASMIAIRMGRQLRARRLTRARPSMPARTGRHRVGVAPGTTAQRAAAAVPAPAAWSISARARRAGRPPGRPWLPLIRPPVWASAAS